MRFSKFIETALSRAGYEVTRGRDSLTLVSTPESREDCPYQGDIRYSFRGVVKVRKVDGRKWTYNVSAKVVDKDGRTFFEDARVCSLPSLSRFVFGRVFELLIGGKRIRSDWFYRTNQIPQVERTT